MSIYSITNLTLQKIKQSLKEANNLLDEIKFSLKDGKEPEVELFHKETIFKLYKIINTINQSEYFRIKILSDIGSNSFPIIISIQDQPVDSVILKLLDNWVFSSIKKFITSPLVGDIITFTNNSFISSLGLSNSVLFKIKTRIIDFDEIVYLVTVENYHDFYMNDVNIEGIQKELDRYSLIFRAL